MSGSDSEILIKKKIYIIINLQQDSLFCREIFSTSHPRKIWSLGHLVGLSLKT